VTRNGGCSLEPSEMSNCGEVGGDVWQGWDDWREERYRLDARRAAIRRACGPNSGWYSNAALNTTSWAAKAACRSSSGYRLARCTERTMRYPGWLPGG
jgi:hypothetical protein